MNFGLLVLIAVLFVFSGVVAVRYFRTGAKRFGGIAMATILGTAAIYLFSLIYAERHPTAFILMLLLVVIGGVFLSAKFLGK